MRSQSCVAVLFAAGGYGGLLAGGRAIARRDGAGTGRLPGGRGAVTSRMRPAGRTVALDFEWRPPRETPPPAVPPDLPDAPTEAPPPAPVEVPEPPPAPRERPPPER